jgi:MarR family 2-MHQ and catechol resistance regulon transcriptional repressor
LTITEIQAKVGLACGSMTAAIDRLERKGLVTRRATPSDRRAKILELTPEGRRVVQGAFGRHAADLEAVMAVLNGAEKRQLYALLKRLGLFAAEARGGRQGITDDLSYRDINPVSRN